MPIEYIALGEKIISNVTLELSLNELHKRINNVYYDVCSAYIKSAEQAIMAIPFSQSPINELHSVLVNLRNSCNLLSNLLYQKKSFLIFEVDVLSKDEKDDLRCKLASLYVAQAIVYCLTTINDNDGISALLLNAKELYKKHILYRASSRNKAGYDEYEGIEYVSDPGEWSGSYQETYSHHDYTAKEKEDYIKSELQRVEEFDKKNWEIIKSIGV